MNKIKLEDEKENIDTNLWTKFIQIVSIIKKNKDKKGSIFYEAKTLVIIAVFAFSEKIIFQEIFEEQKTRWKITMLLKERKKLKKRKRQNK